MKITQHCTPHLWWSTPARWIILTLIVACPTWGCGTDTTDAPQGTGGEAADVVADVGDPEDDSTEPTQDVAPEVDASTPVGDTDGPSDNGDGAASDGGAAGPGSDAPAPQDTVEDTQPALTADATVEDIATEPDSDEPESDGGGQAEGGCVSEQDDAALEAMAATDWSQTMNNCAVGCFGVQDCMVECLADTMGFSMPCATCWAEMLSCSMSACYDVTPGTPEFEGCVAESGCWDGFDTCSGVDLF